MSGQAEQRTVVKGSSSKYVKLNVGGALFQTTIGTLTKQDNMLRAMFSGRMEVLTDAEGNICGDTFIKQTVFRELRFSWTFSSDVN
jgi:BTB/POZ domain-containing adapter for CUL3-mediated RhoA degradation protein